MFLAVYGVIAPCCILVSGIDPHLGINAQYVQGMTHDQRTLRTMLWQWLIQFERQHSNSFATSTWMSRGCVLERSLSFDAGSRVVVPAAIAALPDPVFALPSHSQVGKSYAVKQRTGQ